MCFKVKRIQESQVGDVTHQEKTSNGAANNQSKALAATTSISSQSSQVSSSGSRPIVPTVKSTDATRKPSAGVPNVVAVCSSCLQKGNICRQGAGKKSEMCNSSGVSHSWLGNKVFVLMPSRKRIKQLPNRIPMNCNFALCKHMQDKRKCDWISGGCQFAHSEEEIELWKWMVANKGKR